MLQHDTRDISWHANGPLQIEVSIFLPSLVQRCKYYTNPLSPSILRDRHLLEHNKYDLGVNYSSQTLSQTLTDFIAGLSTYSPVPTTCSIDLTVNHGLIQVYADYDPSGDRYRLLSA